MSEEKRDYFFRVLCELPDEQVHPKAKRRIESLIGRSDAEIKDELLGIVHDCICCGLASESETKTLAAIWEKIGGTAEELREINLRLENATAEEKAAIDQKLKWQR